MLPDLPSPEQPEVPPEDGTAPLVRRVRDGDRSAFDDLYRRLQPSLYAWASVRIRPEFKRALSADDIVHETWLRAAAIMDGFDPERVAFRPWLFGVAKNILFEWQRRLHRTWKDRTPDQGTEGQRALEQIPDDVTAATARLRRDEAMRTFLDRIDALEDEDRRLLLHCGFEGLTLGEASARLGITKDAGTKRWQRLRQRIQRWNLPLELVES